MAENRVKITISADGKNAENAINNLNKKLKDTDTQTKKTSKGMRDLGETVGDDLIASLKKADKGVTLAREGFADIDSSARRLATQVGLTGTQFNTLYSRMLNTRAEQEQERALRDIAVAAQLSENEIRDLGRQMGLSERSIESTTAQARKLSSALKDVDGDAGRLGGSMFSMGNIAKTALAYFGATELIQFGKAVFDTGLQIDTMERSFQAVFGTAEQVQTEFSYLRAEADRLGQNFYDLGGSYKQISAAAKGTALEGKGVRDVFSAVTEASAALGLSSDETSGALNALSQMISKGNVQAEELRGQLGERLPGAFQIAARAMGVSTAELGKMLENGEVLAEDLLPKLAEELHNTYGAAAETAGLESAQSATNKLGEAWTDLKASLSNTELAVSGINAVTGALEHMSDAINGVQESQEAQMLQWGILHQQDLDLATGTWNVTDAMRARYEEVKKGIEAGHALTDSWAQFSKGQKRAEGAAKAAAKTVRAETEKTEKTTESSLKKEQKAREKALKSQTKSLDSALDDWFDEYETYEEKVRREYAETQDKKEKALKDFDRAYEKLTKSEYELARDAVEDQVREWQDAGADIVKIKEWEADQIADILDRETRAHRDAMRAQTLASDDFFGGMSVGWQDVLDEQITWGQAGYSVVRDFTDNASRALSNDLFAIITGEMDDLGQLWDSLWRSMLQTMTDTVARMAVEWATSQLLDWGSGFISAIFHDGTPFVGQDEVIAKLQTGEMIIPRKQADVLRSVVGGGEGTSKDAYFSDVVDTLGSAAGGRKNYGFESLADPDYAGIALGNAMSSLLGAAAVGYSNYSQVQTIGKNLQGTLPGLSSSRIDDVAMDMAKAAGLDAFVNGMFGGFVGDLLSYELGVSEYSKPASLLTTGLAALSGLGLPGAFTGAISPLAGLAISGVMDAMNIRSNETLRDSMERAYGTIGGRRSYQAVSNFLDENWGAAIDPTSNFGLTDVTGRSGKVVGYQFGTGFISIDSATGVATNEQGEVWAGSGWTDLSDWGLDFADRLGEAYGTTSGHIANALDRSLPDWGFDFSQRLASEARSSSGSGYHDGYSNYGGTGWNDSNGGGGSDSGHNVGGERGSSTNTGGGYNDGNGGVTGLWTGGFAEKGHRYWINERGQEMIMPGYDGRVLNAQETSTLISTMQQIAKQGQTSPSPSSAPSISISVRIGDREIRDVAIEEIRALSDLGQPVINSRGVYQEM